MADGVSLYLLVALGAGVAGFVQGLSGFAFGLVAMSVGAGAAAARVRRRRRTIRA